MRDSVQTYLLCQIANGAGGTGTAFFVGDTVFVDQEFGSDATGARELPSKPFATLTAAKNAAIAGDTVFVRPGAYQENNLLKNGVDWFFMPGATVTWNEPGSGSGYGIFDDRASGACVCVIGGYGDFKTSTTTFISGVGNPNFFGLFVIMNASSDISFKSRQLQHSTHVEDGPNGSFAIYVTNCVKTIVECDTITDPDLGTMILGLPAAGGGVYWELGELHVTTKRIRTDQNYCVWFNEPAGANTANAWINIDYLESNLTAFYVSAHSGNYKGWLFFKEMLSASFGSNVLSNGAGGGPKIYLTGQKIATSASNAFTAAAGEVWLTVQKLSGASSANGILRIPPGTTGILYANILQIEDLGGNNAAIQVEGGTLFLDGGYAKVLNGVGINHTGGLSYLNNFRLDTSNTNIAANNPCTVSAAGLILRNCVLVAGTNAASITAGAAQTVKIVTPSAATTAKNANVTLAPNAGFTVDPAIA